MSNWGIGEGGNMLESGGRSGSSLFGVTSGAIHTKGAWVQLLAATSFTYEQVMLQFRPNGANRNFLDLGIGGAGSELVLVPDIQWHGTQAQMGIVLPIRIPVGSRVAMRNQSDVASQVVSCGFIGIGAGPRIPPGYNQAVTYGFDAGTSRGVNLDGGGTANTKSAWVEIVAATTAPIRALTVHNGTGAAATSASTQTIIDIGVGPAGSEQILMADLYQRWTSGGPPQNPCHGPFPVSLPVGVRLAARIAADTTNAGGRSIDVTVTAFC